MSADRDGNKFAFHQIQALCNKRPRLRNRHRVGLDDGHRWISLVWRDHAARGMETISTATDIAMMGRHGSCNHSRLKTLRKRPEANKRQSVKQSEKGE